MDKTASSGVLALGNDVAHAVDLSGSELRIGAESGKTVQYGSATEKVTATHLGGGGGTPDLSGATALQVLGNVSVGQGSTLNLGTLTYSLDAGKSLSVTGANAVLQSGGLVLNGGTLVFDASVGSGALTFAGNISSSAGATVNFTGLSSDLDGRSLTLAGGDWTSVLSSLSSADLHSMRADFSTNTAGNLVVTFAKNVYLWGGDDSAFTWSASSFGSDTGAPNANSNVSFSDAAEKTTVSVDGYVSAAAVADLNN